MKRRGFLGTVTGSAAVGGSAWAESVDLEKPLCLSPAVVMAPRADGVEVVWAVSRLCRGWVEWKGKDGSQGRAAADRFGFVPQGDELLRVRIEGLAAGQDYQLRSMTVSADGKRRQQGSWKDFRTLDPAGAETSFVVWNDTHEHKETLKRLNEESPKGDFLLWNGDTCNNWYKESWLMPTLLNPAGQDLSAGRPLLLVWGNHDVRGEWAYRVPEFVATPNGRPYYAFRSGPVAVICLHSGEDKPDAHPSFGGRVAFEPLREEQAEWLKEVTALPEIRDAPYRVAFCHIPLRWKRERVLTPESYNEGSYDYYSKMSRDLWHQPLVDWGIQVVISGHTHSPALIAANEEFPYAQLVGGGPKLEQATWIEGRANAKELLLVTKKLGGEEIERVSFEPLS